MVAELQGTRAIGIIPARYESTRFPGKPLALIAGKPMIQHVYENAARAELLSRVVVATDDRRIADCVETFGGEYAMTDGDIGTGTERVAAAARNSDEDIILNVQGDEPLAPPDLMDTLVESLMCNPDVPVCTPAARITLPEDINDPNQARVVFDTNMRALYFTRAAVPFNRDNHPVSGWLDRAAYWKHVGIYCYRREFLFRFVELPEGSLEKVEKLEQLRILENGYPVLIVKTGYSPVCVDIPGDIPKVEALMRQSKEM